MAAEIRGRGARVEGRRRGGRGRRAPRGAGRRRVRRERGLGAIAKRVRRRRLPPVRAALRRERGAAPHVGDGRRPRALRRARLHVPAGVFARESDLDALAAWMAEAQAKWPRAALAARGGGIRARITLARAVGEKRVGDGGPCSGCHGPILAGPPRVLVVHLHGRRRGARGRGPLARTARHGRDGPPRLSRRPRMCAPAACSSGRPPTTAWTCSRRCGAMISLKPRRPRRALVVDLHCDLLLPVKLFGWTGSAGTPPNRSRRGALRPLRPPRSRRERRLLAMGVVVWPWLQGPDAVARTSRA